MTQALEISTDVPDTDSPPPSDAPVQETEKGDDTPSAPAVNESTDGIALPYPLPDVAGATVGVQEPIPAAKKRGRPRKGSTMDDAQREHLTRVNVNPNPPPLVPAVRKSTRPVDYATLGNVAANLWFNVGTLLFGQEWEPNIEAGEPAMISGAFKDYFQAKNIAELDPTVALVIVLGSYTLARVQKPTVKQRIGGIFSWVKSKMPGAKRSS